MPLSICSSRSRVETSPQQQCRLREDYKRKWDVIPDSLASAALPHLPHQDRHGQLLPVERFFTMLCDAPRNATEQLTPQERQGIIAALVQNMTARDCEQWLDWLRTHRNEIRAGIQERLEKPSHKMAAADLSEDLNVLATELKYAIRSEGIQSSASFRAGEYRSTLVRLLRAMAAEEANGDAGRDAAVSEVSRALADTVKSSGASRSLSEEDADAYSMTMRNAVVCLDDDTLGKVHEWFARNPPENGKHGDYALRELVKLKQSVNEIAGPQESATTSKARLRMALAVPCLGTVNKSLNGAKGFSGIAFRNPEELREVLKPPAFTPAHIEEFAELHTTMNGIFNARMARIEPDRTSDLASALTEHYGDMATMALNGELDKDIVGSKLSKMGAMVSDYVEQVCRQALGRLDGISKDLEFVRQGLLKDDVGSVIKDSYRVEVASALDSVVEKLHYVSSVAGTIAPSQRLYSPEFVQSLIGLLGDIAHHCTDQQLRTLRQCGAIDPSIPKIATHALQLRKSLEEVRLMPASQGAFARVLREIGDSCLGLNATVAEALARISGKDVSAAVDQSEQHSSDHLRHLFRSMFAGMEQAELDGLHHRLSMPDHVAFQEVVRLLPAAVPGVGGWAPGPTSRALAQSANRWSDCYATFRNELSTHIKAANEDAVPDLKKYRRHVEQALKDAYGLVATVSESGVRITASVGTDFVMRENGSVELVRIKNSNYVGEQLGVVSHFICVAPEGDLAHRSKIVFPDKIGKDRLPVTFTVADQWARDVDRCTMTVGEVHLTVDDFASARLERVGTDPQALRQGKGEVELRTTTNPKLYALLTKLLELCGGDREKLFRATQQMNQASQAGACMALQKEGTFGAFGTGEIKQMGRSALTGEWGAKTLDVIVAYTCASAPNGQLAFSARTEIPRVNALAGENSDNGELAYTWLDPDRSFIKYTTNWTMSRDGKRKMDEKNPCELSYVLVGGAQPT